VAGASWAHDELLSKHPKLRIRVYAVWLDVLPGDARDQLDSRILSDPRVTQFWDEGKASGEWFATHVSGEPKFAWDAFYLYGPDSRWNTVPTDLLSSGSPVISGRDALTKALGQ